MKFGMLGCELVRNAASDAVVVEFMFATAAKLGTVSWSTGREVSPPTAWQPAHQVRAIYSPWLTFWAVAAPGAASVAASTANRRADILFMHSF